jgi:hypothetical protein
MIAYSRYVWVLKMYAKFIGIGPETAALIEERRRSPSQSEDEILLAALRPADKGQVSSSTAIGCDLGKGAILRDQERLYLFRYKSSKDRGEPEAVAIATAGKLVLFGKSVKKSRGSLVTPALKTVQERLNDRDKRGRLTSLDAWKYWFVHRSGVYVPAGELRDSSKIVRRGRRRLPPMNIDLNSLGL